MSAFADRPAIEQGQALQVVMGALKIAWYPPDPLNIRATIEMATVTNVPGIETLRRELAALGPAQFFEAFKAGYSWQMDDAEEFGLVGFGPMGGVLAAYGRALIDTSEPNWHHLRHFEKTQGYERGQATFMARFFNQILEHLGEPERSDFEQSIIGTGPVEERTRRWARFIAKNPPAWLLAHMAIDAVQHSKPPSVG